METHPLEQVIALVGLSRVAEACGKTHQAVRKWQRAGRLPRTEWTGETAYAKRIAALGGGKVTAEQLLGAWPKWPAQQLVAAAPLADQPLELVDRRERELAIEFPDRRVRPTVGGA